MLPINWDRKIHISEAMMGKISTISEDTIMRLHCRILESIQRSL